MELVNKKILVGVTASIASYKTTFLIRQLVQERAHVKVIITPEVKNFISPLTFSTLAKNDVYCDFFDKETGHWHNHVEIGHWADIFIFAPLTANTIAKMAHGICDNLLLATYFSSKCPILLAPAMDLDMYQHPITQQNLEKLKSLNNFICDSPYGELASGLVGKGRMEEPQDLIDHIKNIFTSKKILRGKNILITSGPTIEAIDSVRYISNYSTGKMGNALAEVCVSMGANVKMISGPVKDYFKHPNVNLIKVQSAEEMFFEANEYYDDVDITIFVAAVSDYRVENISNEKIKKTTQSINLKLIENKDIALELGKRKKDNQINVGFALEDTINKSGALDKLKKKNFDFIVLNALNEDGAGFSNNTNKVTIFDKEGKEYPFGLKSKLQVAQDILDLIVSKM